MKAIVNILGAVLIFGIAVLVLGQMRRENAYHVSTLELQKALLATLPETSRSQANLSIVRKANSVYVSTIFKFADGDELNNFVNEMKNQQWRETNTPLADTRIFCKNGAVYKVISPKSRLEKGAQYYLETSSGNYSFYCKGE